MHEKKFKQKVTEEKIKENVPAPLIANSFYIQDNFTGMVEEDEIIKNDYYCESDEHVD